MKISFIILEIDVYLNKLKFEILKVEKKAKKKDLEEISLPA